MSEHQTFALQPSDPIAWRMDGDYFCADHGTKGDGSPLEGVDRVVTRGELTTDDWYVCEDCGRPALWADGAAAVADVIGAAHMAGYRADAVPTGGGCEAVEITRDDMAGYIYVTDGDAGLPDGGAIVVGRYDEDGSDVGEVDTMPHDMPRLISWLRNL